MASTTGHQLSTNPGQAVLCSKVNSQGNSCDQLQRGFTHPLTNHSVCPVVLFHRLSTAVKTQPGTMRRSMSVLELEAVLLNQKDKASLLESLELLDFTKCDEKGELCVGRFSFSKLIDQKKYGIVLHGVSCFLFFFCSKCYILWKKNSW